jgi:DEAD/DEAH box helicase domain-containing protein
MRVITWDTEIRDSPEGQWEAARRGSCGCSCIVLYDTFTAREYVYDESLLESAVSHLNAADLLIGFNSLEWDTPLVQTLSARDVLPEQYDILNEIWKALGTRVKGYKLDDLCKRMELGEKLNNGAGAIELYRQGRFNELWEYCAQDVQLTRKLANYINETGGVLTPDGDVLAVQGPGIEA